MTAKDIVKSEPAQRFDIVLDFTCWVHHTRRRWWRRLMFNMRHLEQTAIWEEGDSGGFVLDHKSLLQSAVRQAGLHAVPTANTDIPAPSYLPETFVKKSHIQYVDDPPHFLENRFREQVTFHWWPIFDRELVLLRNIDRADIRELIDTCFDSGAYVPLESLALESLAARIGLVNSRIADTALRAAAREKILEKTIKERGNVVRHQRTLGYVPLSYLNLRQGKRFCQYFANGNTHRVHRLPPKLSLCPWRTSFWAAAGLALLGAGLSVVQLLPAFAAGGVTLLPLLGLAPAALAAAMGEGRDSVTWLLCDDGDGTAWRRCAEQAKQWAREGRAHIEDPYYTTLLEGSSSDVQRFSFRLAFTFPDSRKRLELVYLSPAGLAAAGPELTSLGQDAQGLTWFSRKSSALLDSEIAQTLARLDLTKRNHELRLVRPTDLAGEPLPRVEALLRKPGSILQLITETEAPAGFIPEPDLPLVSVPKLADT